MEKNQQIDNEKPHPTSLVVKYNLPVYASGPTWNSTILQEIYDKMEIELDV